MRVVASEYMSLDGVMQAPGGPQEDPSGGFEHGGWSLPFFDPAVMGKAVADVTTRGGALLQGATTYRVSSTAWPERAGAGDPFAEWINAAPKYVVSDTLTEADLAWQPTTIIRRDDLVTEVSALRERPGGDIFVYGSLSIVRKLLDEGLIDELVLMIEPIALGGGKTLFPTDGQVRNFELVNAEIAATGVLLCRYRPLH